MLVRQIAAAAIIGVAAFFAASISVSAETTVRLWSHWADHTSKVAFVEEAARKFEAANPGVKVKVEWYQFDALIAALKAALRAGQGPDIYFAEPDQVEYIENGFAFDLSRFIDWSRVEPWAKETWTSGKGVYGFPLEAWTVELYYNKKALQKLDVALPENGQLSQAAFLELVQKARAAGMTPISLGVGDRPYPGAFLTHEALLKRLGKDDYQRLLEGKIMWSDPRVVKTLGWVKQVIDAGALPKSFTSLKLGESHTYFHTNPGAVMFLMGSFYPSRAFNKPEQGGQPADFELGIMQFPAMDEGACNLCKTIVVGGSYVVNENSKNRELAAKFLNSMANPEAGNKWLEAVLVQTGIKSDASKIGGPHARYFKDLAKANDGINYFIGAPRNYLRGQRREVFTQLINAAFPAGTVGVSEVVKQLDAAKN
jgi:multiple sugar transport system substrate-binding protein